MFAVTTPVGIALSRPNLRKKPLHSPLACYNIVIMTKNLVAIGNSLGIIIEKPILDLLKIERDTPLEVRTDGEQLLIRPAIENDHSKRVKEASRWVIKNHEKTLRKLAE